MAIQQSPNAGLRELALFAGAGGGILAGQMLGWRTVCAVEWEAYPASVLAARQNDGLLEPFPIWDDVRTFDGTRWRGRVDVVSGGFPCQDISAAGKGAGIEGERSGMWVEMARIIGEVRPSFVFVENSPMLTSRGLGRVLGDLAALGFDAEWGVLGAADVGAPHRRDRIWIVAYSNSQHSRHIRENLGNGVRRQGAYDAGSSNFDTADVAHANSQPSPQRGNDLANASSGRCGQGDAGRGRGNDRRQLDATKNEALAHAGSNRLQGRGQDRPVAGSAGLCSGEMRHEIKPVSSTPGEWWLTEPDVGRVAHGVAHRVDRLKAIGNGQVPQCAAAAFIEGYRRLTK